MSAQDCEFLPKMAYVTLQIKYHNDSNQSFSCIKSVILIIQLIALHFQKVQQYFFAMSRKVGRNVTLTLLEQRFKYVVHLMSAWSFETIIFMQHFTNRATFIWQMNVPLCYSSKPITSISAIAVDKILGIISINRIIHIVKKHEILFSHRTTKNSGHRESIEN